MSLAHVAPLAGAWIEIAEPKSVNDYRDVAPLAGAWIEILVTLFVSMPFSSLPSRERGLKLFISRHTDTGTVVAPLAGAWIEM